MAAARSARHTRSIGFERGDQFGIRLDRNSFTEQPQMLGEQGQLGQLVCEV